MVPVSTDEMAAQFAAAVERATVDPQWFFTFILRAPALPWQLEAINAVLDVRRAPEDRVVNFEGKPRISIRSCHGTGKTHFLALLMHLWNFTTYGKIACTAPKEAQLTKRLWPRYRKLRSTATHSYKQSMDVKTTEITCWNDPDWGAIAETASDPDNLAGYHDTPQLFLVDEASARRLDPMFPVIEGALTTPGSVLVEIGNPTRTEGEFHAHHTKKGIKELYHLIHVKPTDAPGLISQKWVDIMITKYGIDSPIVKIRVLGEFAAFDEYTLIPVEFFEEALDIEEQTDGSAPKLRLSIDVSDGGADSTIITAAWHYETFTQIVAQKAINVAPNIATNQIIKTAVSMYEGFKGDVRRGDDFVVDGLGVGAGVVSGLVALKYNVVNYKGSETKGVNTDRFRNRRVQSYISLYEAFRDSTIRISPEAVDDADAEEFRAHLMSIKRPKNSLEKIDDIETKDKMKRDGLPSPDRADSLAMQMATQAPVTLSGNTDLLLFGTMGAYDDASLV